MHIATSSDFILHSQQTARTESANLRDHMKEQAQLISRLKQEKKEGNRLLKRELEEMLEVCVGRAMSRYPLIVRHQGHESTKLI